MTSFGKIFRIPSSHVLETKFHSYGTGCLTVGSRWSMTTGDSLSRSMKAGRTPTRRPANERWLGEV
jgi:hypothetical protein